MLKKETSKEDWPEQRKYFLRLKKEYERKVKDRKRSETYNDTLEKTINNLEPNFSFIDETQDERKLEEARINNERVFVQEVANREKRFEAIEEDSGERRLQRAMKEAILTEELLILVSALGNNKVTEEVSQRLNDLSRMINEKERKYRELYAARYNEVEANDMKETVRGMYSNHRIIQWTAKARRLLERRI